MDQPRLANQLFFIFVFPEVTDDELRSLSVMAAAETFNVLVSMAMPLDMICFYVNNVEHNTLGHWRTHLAQRRVVLYVQLNTCRLYEFLPVIFVYLKMCCE